MQILPTIKSNQLGGILRSGVSYTTEKKTETALVYLEMLEEGISVSDRALSKRARVGKTFANKIITEMASRTGVQMPSDPKQCNIS